MKISSSNLLILAFSMALTACSDDRAAKPSGASAHASPTATAAASPAAAQYTIDLQTSGIEQAPEGTTLDPVPHDSDIYIPSDDPDAQVHLAFSLSQKGDFNVAEGTGTLTAGGRSVPFEIDQISVMHQEKLSGGQTLYYGGLQVDSKGNPSTFAFGFRFIPQTQELQLRLSNGEGLIVFGGGDAIAKNEKEIERLEAGHRPKNGTGAAGRADLDG